MKDLVASNKACLFKLRWRFMIGESKIWCQVLKGKYDRESNNFKEIIAKNTDSSLQKTIAKDLTTMQALSYWDIGNGTKISVWTILLFAIKSSAW